LATFFLVHPYLSPIHAVVLEPEKEQYRYKKTLYDGLQGSAAHILQRQKGNFKY
jgi:hypothetical protein